jgi:hypothetical protein
MFELLLERSLFGDVLDENLEPTRGFLIFW